MEPESSRTPAALIRTPNMFASLRTAPHEIEERKFKRPISSETMIAHAELLADALNTREVRLQPLQVLFASQVRINVKVATRFHVMKEHCFVEIKTQLSRI